MRKRIRRFSAVLLILCMVFGAIADSRYAVTVKAAEADGIESGSTYILKSALNEELVLMPKNSKPGWDYVYLFDKTGTNSQKWVFTYNGSNYSAQNAGTRLWLHYSEGVRDAHVDQNGYDGTDFYKWNLIKLTEGAYAGGYMLEAVREADGNKYYMTADENGRGVELYLRAKNTDNPAGQVWYFEKADKVEDTSVKREQVLEVSRAYLNKYFVDTRQSDGSTRKSLGGGFWVGAELCEMMLDGYETTGDIMYREAFESSYQDLLDNISERYTYWTGMTHEDWADNPFNDDIMWLTIASVRAYLLFGKGDGGYTDYLEYARKNFKTVIDRGTLSDGTIRWSHEEGRGEGTTSCINGPTVVAACYLAKATGDDSYYETARKIHAAQRKTMYDAGTGRVYDSPSSQVALTYNAGTWLGSCVMLYERYKDQEYLDDAVKSMNYVMGKDFCDNGILCWEDAKTGPDLPVFRSILMRYIRKFIVELNTKTDVTDALKWMQRNAEVAYQNRNHAGLIHTPWHWATENDADYGSAGMSGAVSLFVNLPTYGAAVNRNAYERIEAENFDYVKGIMTEGTQDSDGNGQVAGVRREYYTGYANVDFGSRGASEIELRVSTDKAGGFVEVRLDSPTGMLLGSVDLPHTGSWGSYATASGEIARIPGIHTVYLVYQKGDNDWVCNLNWFRFKEASQNGDDAVVIKSEASGKRFVCNSGGNGKISASGEGGDSFEQFKVIYNDDRTVSFQSIVNKKYVSAVIDDTDEQNHAVTPYLTARSDAIGDREKFYVESFGGESMQFAIRAKANGKYLQVNPDSQDGTVTVTGDQIGGVWETFNMESPDGAWVLPGGAISAYQVRYYKQNPDFLEYTEAEQDGYRLNGNVGANVKAEEKVYAGFHLNTEKSRMSGDIQEHNKLTLSLYYDRNEYVIRYMGTDGVSNYDNLTKSYRYGETVVLESPKKEGYTFDGWYLEEEYRNKIERVTEEMTGDLTLYAKFTVSKEPDDTERETTYSVEYYKQNPKRDGYVKEISDTLTLSARVGETVTSPEKAYTGFVKNKEKSQESGTVLSDGGLVLKVFYDRQTYEIRYMNIEGIGNASLLPTEYVYGVGIAELAQPQKQGYTFDGWYLEEEYRNKIERVTEEMTGDLTLYAKFTVSKEPDDTERETTYSVEYYKQNPKRDGYVKEISDTLTLSARVGETVTSPEKAYTGFVKNKEKSQESGTVLSDGGLVLKVFYDRQTYEIRYMNIEGIGNASLLPTEYVYGVGIAELAQPQKQGYTFEGWFADENYAEKKDSISPGQTGTVALYAKFKKNSSVGNEGSGGSGSTEVIGGGQNNNGNNGNNSNTGNTAQTVKPGEKFKKSKFEYKILTVQGKAGTLQLVRPIKKTYKKLSIPKTVKYRGIIFTVSAIAKDAFKNNKNLKSITIGGGVTEIGARAFYGCKKLSRLNLKGVKLKKVGPKAFKKTNGKLRIKAGNARNVKKCKRMLRKKIPNSAKIIKS